MTDLDFTNSKNTWRLTKKYIFYIGGGSVFWAAKKQKTVAMSTI